MTQKERIIELLEEREILTVKQIQEHTGFKRASIRSVLSIGERKKIFRRVCTGFWGLRKEH